jgi:hypothetical protein
VVVGHMDDSGLPDVVVATKKILFRAHAQVGCRHRDIGIKREIVRRVAARTFSTEAGATYCVGASDTGTASLARSA